MCVSRATTLPQSSYDTYDNSTLTVGVKVVYFPRGLYRHFFPPSRKRLEPLVRATLESILGTHTLLEVLERWRKIVKAVERVVRGAMQSEGMEVDELNLIIGDWNPVEGEEGQKIKKMILFELEHPPVLL